MLLMQSADGWVNMSVHDKEISQKCSQIFFFKRLITNFKILSIPQHLIFFFLLIYFTFFIYCIYLCVWWVWCVCVCVWCVCVCVCGHVYVVYEDTNLYNDMGMT